MICEISGSPLHAAGEAGLSAPSPEQPTRPAEADAFAWGELAIALQRNYAIFKNGDQALADREGHAFAALRDYAGNHETEARRRQAELALLLGTRDAGGPLWRCVHEIERVGDNTRFFFSLADRAREGACPFSPEALDEFGRMFEKLDELFFWAETALRLRADGDAWRSEAGREALRLTPVEAEAARRILENHGQAVRRTHAERQARGECDPRGARVHRDVMDLLSRIGGHLAEAVAAAAEDATATASATAPEAAERR